MKKLITALFMCGIAAMSFAAEELTNVYDLSIKAKVPYLYNGVRSYSSQTLKGLMYATYIDDELTEVHAVVTNTKTKVVHTITFDDGFYYLMGKETKRIERSTPTVYFGGKDTEILALRSDAHETIKSIALAGSGSLKSIKSVIVGCGACGTPTKTTEYCNILWSMSGNVVGVMDCACPDDEYGWSHTLKTVLCGIYYNGDDEAERVHDASFYGTWSAKFNKKLSDTEVK